MIGISLHPAVIAERPATEAQNKLMQEFGSFDGLALFLRGLGVTHVEVRNIAPGDDPAAALAVARRVWDAGFTLTVHTAQPKAEGSFAQSFPALLPLLEEARAHQDGVTLTIHAVSSKTENDLAGFAAATADRLRRWSEEAEALGFRLALEEDRQKGDFDPGETCEGVLGMLEGNTSPYVGTCFDFGHFCVNAKNNGEDPTLPPPEAFLQRCIHTHIHALGAKTHFPLEEDCYLPLDAYVSALTRAGYRGVFNLELAFDRYPERDLRNAIRHSVLQLEAAVRRAKVKFDDERHALRDATDGVYNEKLLEMARELAAPPRRPDCFYMFNASGMIFRLGDRLLGVDPALRTEQAQAAAEEGARAVLSLVPDILLTHFHADHFDPRFVKRVSDLDCRWYMPDFEPGLVEASGLSADRITYVHPGDTFDLGEVHVEVLPGRHIEHCGKGVPEVCYLLTAGGKRIFIPADVRNYDLDTFPQVYGADVLFANVWLGRGVSEQTPDWRYEEYANYVAALRPKKVFLGHLMEYSRSSRDIWSWEHAGRVMDGLTERLPGTPAYPLHIFDCYEL